MMQISQIFINEANSLELSLHLQYATSTIKALFPDADYKLYGNEDLRSLIKSHYDEEVLWAFDTLQPYAYKADLGRYCVLNAIGGWYFDIGLTGMTPVEIGTRCKLLAFRDIQRFSLTSFACSVGVLYSQPNNHALSIAIRQVVENCKTRYYGTTPLCPTGPTLFGQSIAKHGSDTDYILGDYLELTPCHEQVNRAFVLPNGSIMAWSKPAEGGDLTALGAVGTNNYNRLWYHQNVYGEQQ